MLYKLTQIWDIVIIILSFTNLNSNHYNRTIGQMDRWTDRHSDTQTEKAIYKISMNRNSFNRSDNIVIKSEPEEVDVTSSGSADQHRKTSSGSADLKPVFPHLRGKPFLPFGDPNSSTHPGKNFILNFHIDQSYAFESPLSCRIFLLLLLPPLKHKIY